MSLRGVFVRVCVDGLRGLMGREIDLDDCDVVVCGEYDPTMTCDGSWTRLGPYTTKETTTDEAKGS